MTTRRVGALFIIFGFIVLVGGFFNHWMLVTVGSSGSLLRELVDQLYANIAVDSIGIGVVVLVIDSLNEKQRREETLEQLIREMKSLDNGIALRAVGELRALGHLADGVLSGRDFFMANLERAPFKFVVINDTAFGHANMRAANLMHADLRQCRLRKPDRSKDNGYSDVRCL